MKVITVGSVVTQPLKKRLLIMWVQECGCVKGTNTNSTAVLMPLKQKLHITQKRNGKK